MAKSSGGGASGSGGRSSGASGFGNARNEFNFVQKRLAAGGLKKGERKALEQRSERLAKEILGVK